ncbi:import inner membrane translocase subunit Tim44 [Thermodesulfobium narugense DSM 14796]|uniref:Import inner membrane translocase subunit Tim44 n=1 Tax=Thermodesulfobium narugense DSM 14796 TaxID=747365 RepID=M1E6L5_9BACT|nr:TIM44-like domain-containing protein [Thermodesulfobium narugense]AEE14851.1 import inner membrane translocase subunit Tim44 [Thermodesulfobium narugense DSM 14796]
MLKKVLILFLLLSFAFSTFNLEIAFSKAGGGKSFGTTGTHSYSAGNKYVSPNLNTPKTTPTVNPNSNQSQPSFLRNFLSGFAGALASIALFSILGSLFGFSGPNGSLAGFFLIIIIAFLLIYLVNSFAKRRFERDKNYNVDSLNKEQYNTSSIYNDSFQGVKLGSIQAKMDVDRGLKEIERAFPSFSEEDLRSKIKEIFVNIQKAWSEKNFTMLRNLTTNEMFLNFQKQIEELNKNGITNFVENISVKRMDLVDAWMEDEKIYVTYKIEATMTDYDVDVNDNILRGNKDKLIDFQELWSFVSKDSIKWELSAINQL